MSRSQRVVHLTTAHHVFDPRIFYKEARSLSEAGYETYVVARHDREDVVHGVRILPLSPRKGRAGRLGLQREVFRKARRLKADVYHIHDPELLPVSYALKRTQQTCIIYDKHEHYAARGGLEGRLLDGLERWSYRWIDHLILAEESYQALVPPDRVPTTVVLNYFRPVDDQAPEPSRSQRRGDDGFRLLYAGVQSRRRGLEVLVDLAHLIKIRQRPWTIHLVGKAHLAADRAWADAKIRELEVEGIIERTGWDRYVPWEAMEPEYRRAHVGLALLKPWPNFTGSLPTKFYEYMHYGLPILCSDFPLWRRFVETHGCGQVVDPTDAGAVFDVLDAWYREPETSRQLADAARAAAPRFHWNHMRQRLEEVYRAVLETRQ